MIDYGIVDSKYEIYTHIKTGDHFDTYIAKDIRNKREVAIRIIKRELGKEQSINLKYQKAAEKLLNIFHPNLITVYDVGQFKNNCYIVTELVEGITLERYIERQQCLGFKEVVSICIQMCWGISYLNEHGIVHNDIQPGNVIISKNGKIKVNIAGIPWVKYGDSAAGNKWSYYSAPEHTFNTLANEKTDIYAIGICLYEMFTGSVPFLGDTIADVMRKHKNSIIPTVIFKCKDAPVCVDAIILKCCSKDPEDRYGSVQELCEDLKQALATPNVNFVKLPDKKKQIKYAESVEKISTGTDKPVEKLNSRTDADSPIETKGIQKLVIEAIEIEKALEKLDDKTLGLAIGEVIANHSDRLR